MAAAESVPCIPCDLGARKRKEKEMEKELGAQEPQEHKRLPKKGPQKSLETDCDDETPVKGPRAKKAPKATGPTPVKLVQPIKKTEPP